jgi:hypothetical protein
MPTTNVSPAIASKQKAKNRFYTSVMFYLQSNMTKVKSPTSRIYTTIHNFSHLYHVALPPHESAMLLLPLEASLMIQSISTLAIINNLVP